LQGTDRPSFNETYSTPNVGTGLTLTPSGTVIDGNGGNNYTYTFVAVSTGVITAKTSATTVAALASSSLDPSTYGQSVTFEAAVATTDCLPTAIAGTVAFYDGKPGAGGIEIGSPQAVTAGHASIATATLSAGMHAIYAVYSPDPSTGTVYTSAPLSQKVAAANALVTITLVSPGGGGDPFYTVLARVTTNVPGLVPTGTISFRVGRGRPQTRALSNGIAILERTRSRPVNQTFHVTFQGDRTLFVTSPAQRVL
ncbi:MAG: Ig-like domain-containing protein, partial [Isosphaeraceae bacterium]